MDARRRRRWGEAVADVDDQWSRLHRWLPDDLLAIGKDDGGVVKSKRERTGTGSRGW